MASEWITQFSQQYGLSCSPTGNVFGKVGGYFVSVTEQGIIININLSYFADATERDKVNKVNFKMKEDTNITTLSGNGGASLSGTSIRLPNTPQAQSVIYSLITNYTQLFAELGLSAEKKAVPVQQAPTAAPTTPVSGYSAPQTTTYNNPTGNTSPYYSASSRPTTPTSYPNQQSYRPTSGYNTPGLGNMSNYNTSGPTPRKKPSYSTAYNSGVSSVFMGLIGALIGAFVGAIPWMILIALDITYTIILVFAAFVIAGCAIYGYNRLGGSSDPTATSLIITLSVAGVAVGSMFLVYALTYVNKYSCSLSDAFDMLWLAADYDSSFKFTLIFNSIVSVIIGIVASVTMLKKK